MNADRIFLLNWWYNLVGGNKHAAIRVLFIAFLAGLLGVAGAAWQNLRAKQFTMVQATLAVYPTHFRWISTPNLQTLQRPRNDARNMALVMAKGPNVINEVIRRMGDRLPENWRTREELLKHLAVHGGQGVYVYLSVSAPTPDLAYNLAETWAQVVEDEVEKAFYRYDNDIPLLEDELKKTAQKLREAEAAIEDFRRRTGIGLVDESQVVVSVQDRESLSPGISGFRAQVVELGNVNTALGEYRHAQKVLRYLAKEVRRAGEEGRSLDTVPLELLTTLRPVTTRGRITLDALRALGDDYQAIADALENEADNLQPAIDFLGEQSDALQAEIAANLTEERELIRQRNAVETLYKALLTKVEELRAEAAVASNYVHIVDVRERTVSRLVGLLMDMVAGGILGVFLGFTLATTWYYARSRPIEGT